jgi:hypothetical protein
MKKLMLLLVALLAIAVPVYSQGNVRDPHSGPIQSVGAPVGACEKWWIDVDTTTGNLYTCNQGEWNLSSSSGTINSGTVGNPVVYGTTSGIKSSNQNVDASAFPAGTHWTDKAALAVTALGANGGTIVIPDSIADNGSATTLSVPSNVTLSFPGNATFTFCTLRMGKFSKAIATAGAALIESGSNCPGIEYIDASPTLQDSDHPMLSGVRVNCASQTNSTGITIGPASSGGTAMYDLEDVEVTGCTTVGIIATQMQFSHWRNVHLQQNYVNFKLYGSGAGSSNIFDGLKTDSNSSGVNVIVVNNSNTQDAGGNVFINPQLQNGTVASMAVIGDSGDYQPNLVIIGSQPELNSPCTGSVTIDSRTIPCSGALYVSNAVVVWDDPNLADASASPDVNVVNGGVVTIRNLTGFGNPSGTVCQADSTSVCNLPGYVNSNGLAENVSVWPSALAASGTSAFRMYGAPNLFYTTSIPNMLNNTSGSAMFPAYAAFGTGASGTSAIDSTYGVVASMTFAASSGTDCSANCVNFGNAIASALGASNDIFVSFLLKSSAAASFRITGGGATFATMVVTVPTTWTRYVFYMPNQAANTNFQLHITAQDTTGANLLLTGMEVLQYPAQSVTANQYISYALTGATNPDLNKTPTVTAGTGASVTSWENLSPSELVMTINVGTGGTASTAVLTLAEAPTGWNCSAFDITNPTTGGGYNVKQTASSNFPATVTLTGYNTSGSATAWTASDILRVKCSAY